MKDKTGKKLTTFDEFFHKLPVEIQLYILKLCVCKPACHTLRMEKQEIKVDGKVIRWFPILRLNSGGKDGDPSPYRVWRTMPWIATGARDILLKEMVSPKIIKLGGAARSKAIVDVATDVVILQFSYSGSTAFPCNWAAEHIPGLESTLDIGHTRCSMSNLTRLALRYNVDMNLNDRRIVNPFQCRCPPSSWSQHSKDFKFCPLQLAGFLDLFRNLEKFYFIMANKNYRTKTWFRNYQSTSPPLTQSSRY